MNPDKSVLVNWRPFFSCDATVLVLYFQKFKNIELPMEFQKQAVKIFKALADETRYKIIRLLLERGEMSCADFDQEFSLSKPAMSHHYRVLENSGLILTRKKGLHIFVRLNEEIMNQFLPDFKKVHRKYA